MANLTEIGASVGAFAGALAVALKLKKKNNAPCKRCEVVKSEVVSMISELESAVEIRFEDGRKVMVALSDQQHQTALIMAKVSGDLCVVSEQIKHYKEVADLKIQNVADKVSTQTGSFPRPQPTEGPKP